MDSTKQKDYSESGIGSENSATDEAIKTFFNSLAKQWEDDPALDVDQTIDLNNIREERNLVVRQPSPIKPTKQPSSAPASVNRMKPKQIQQQVDKYQPSKLQIEEKNSNLSPRDPSLEELEFLHNQINLGKTYSRKLTTIMLEGLQKTLGNELYEAFVIGCLPNNFWPIIRMNDENTPYVEFIIKCDWANQDLVSQLCGYSQQHMIYCAAILRHLYTSAKRERCSKNNLTLESSSKSALPAPPLKKSSSKQPRVSTQKKINPVTKERPREEYLEDELVSMNPLPMRCSTPKPENK